MDQECKCNEGKKFGMILYSISGSGFWRIPNYLLRHLNKCLGKRRSERVHRGPEHILQEIGDVVRCRTLISGISVVSYPNKRSTFCAFV